MLSLNGHFMMTKSYLGGYCTESVVPFDYCVLPDVLEKPAGMICRIR